MQEKVAFNHKNMLNFCIVYEVNLWSFHLDSKFALGSSLYGTVKFTKTTDPGNYFYFGYGVWCDARECQMVVGLMKM